MGGWYPTGALRERWRLVTNDKQPLGAPAADLPVGSLAGMRAQQPGTTPGRVVVGALVGILLATAGCSAGNAGASRPPAAGSGSASGSGSPTTAPTAYHHYVALGDSYTAAPLVPPTDTSTICLRSGVNYPALVARAMPGTQLTDVSCSGATTGNVTARQLGQSSSVPAQIGAVSRRTDLVTIGLGGNDDGLFGSVLGRCLQIAASDPTGAPCQTAFAAEDPTRLSRTFGDIRRNIAGVVAEVRRRAPHARVLVVGYPQIVPAAGRCDDLPLAAGDYAFGRRINHGLTEAVRRGAAAAHADYVDLWRPSAGHDICGAEPWINGRVTAADRALAYHPLAVEQEHVAQLVLDEIR
jgi:lysophospholipase L1-like esterase